MSILTTCPGCARKLKVRDDLAGRTIKCPKCGAAMPVGGSGPPAPTWQETVPLPKKIRKSNWPAKTPTAKPPERPRPTREAQPEPEPEYVPELVEEDEDEPVEKPASVAKQEDVKKKRKRKKKKAFSLESERVETPVWWWWAGAFAALLVVVLSGYAMAMRSDSPAPLFFLGLKIVILLPIGFVVLIISFLLSSLIGGGIDFGPVSIAIPKALILLLVSTLVELFDLSFYIDSIVLLIIWFVGLMALFHLDPWETWFVIIINWVFLKAAFFAAIMLFLLIATRGGEAMKVPDDSPHGTPPPMPKELVPGGGGLNDGE